MSPCFHESAAKTHFQDLLLAQTSQGLFISNTMSMSGAADTREGARIRVSAAQIVELLALTHVAPLNLSRKCKCNSADQVGKDSLWVKR